MHTRIMLGLGGVLGALAVGSGAFAAHALKDKLTPADLAVMETAVRYQLVHALALCVCAALVPMVRRAEVAAWCFGLGTLLFSGSLQALVLTGVRGLGAVTPVGGVLLVAGWLVLAVAGRRPGLDAR